MDIKSLSIPFELKREPDQDGTFEGYASVFDIVDGGLDVVNRGAFTKSLDRRKPKLLWQHDMAQPIGVFDEIKEDERGLYVKGRLSKDVQKGAEAMALLRMGAIDSMSIGYRTIEAAKEGDGSVRRLMQVELYEVSLVTIPMLEAATVTDVKSIKTIREFEKAMRDAGFSKTEAKAISVEGFKGLADHRDDVEVEADNGFDDETLTLLKQLQEKMTNV